MADLQRIQQDLEHFRIALLVMNNEILRLGLNNPAAQPIIDALNFFIEWYNEINQDYHIILNQANGNAWEAEACDFTVN